MIPQQTSSASTLPDRAGHYLGLLEEHEHHGGSLRSFAEARGLSVWTLYGWRRRLGLTRPRATTSSSGLVAVDIVNDRPASRTAAGEQLEVQGTHRRIRRKRVPLQVGSPRVIVVGGEPAQTPETL